MTPAITLLDEQGIPYSLHSYEHDPSVDSYGDEAVAQLGVEANRVFKTLLVECSDGRKAVAVIPVEQRLQLKRVAKHLRAKKAKMADTDSISRTTGYIAGGMSPIGQTQTLPTFLDSSARQFETIFVSAGKRGLEVELSADALVLACSAELIELCS